MKKITTEQQPTMALLIGSAPDAVLAKDWNLSSFTYRVAINNSWQITPDWDFVAVRRAGIALAREVERRAPDLVTTSWWKELRGDRIFIDYNQMARDRTIASSSLGDIRYGTTCSATQGLILAGR